MLVAFLWMLFLGTFDVPIDSSTWLARPKPVVNARPALGSGALHAMEDGTTQPPPQ
jgi:hypothetical protein